MRTLGLAPALALTLALSTGAGLGIGAAVADDGTPTKREVHQAQEAARGKARDVAAVQAELAVANQRVQEAGVAAAQAAEAWNGARYRLQQARQKAKAAEQRSALATADVERQQQAYADTLASSYSLAPELTAFSAIVGSDGIETVIDRTATLSNAASALDATYDEFRASSTLADVATRQAQEARDEAADLQAEARAKRDEARAAADAAAAEAQAVAEQKDALIGELARLQHTSKKLAQQRQSDLEARAAAAAAAAAQAEAEAEAEAAAQAEAAEQAAQEQEQQEQEQEEQPATPAPTPSAPPAPTPTAPPAPPAPPAPAGGAGAAIAFARAQLGEPYRWGAAGPDAWDCSGLTAGAWGAGGTYLPHYSVAQYDQSTPISAGQLQPGDLVFWGSSSDPSSIYHVALYIGGGQIIHAPRTGRPVTQDSLYYWTAPNFYARP